MKQYITRYIRKGCTVEHITTESSMKYTMMSDRDEMFVVDPTVMIVVTHTDGMKEIVYKGHLVRDEEENPYKNTSGAW